MQTSHLEPLPQFEPAQHYAAPELAHDIGALRADYPPTTHQGYHEGDSVSSEDIYGQTIVDLGNLRDDLRSGSLSSEGYDREQQLALVDDLANTTLDLFKLGAYEDHPDELLRTLRFFSVDTKEEGGFLNELLDLDPSIQSWLIDEFNEGSRDLTIANIVTSRGFIRRLSRKSGDARMKRLGSNEYTEADQTAMEDYLKLEAAVLTRSGFNEDEQRDIIDAWSAVWANKKKPFRPWKTKKGAKDGVSDEELNLEATAALFRRKQHAAKILYDNYGIRNFGRYYDKETTRSALEPQLSPNYIPSKNVALTAVKDESGDFMAPTPVQSAKAVKLDDPTYMEARTPMEALRRMIGTNGKAVGGKLIDRLLVSAHGNKDEIDDLTIEDMSSFQGLEKLEGRLFSQDALIILDSCDTAKRNGIARRLYERTNISVAAPYFTSRGVHMSKRGNYTFERKWVPVPVRGRYYGNSYTPRHSHRINHRKMVRTVS